MRAALFGQVCGNRSWAIQARRRTMNDNEHIAYATQDIRTTTVRAMERSDPLYMSVRRYRMHGSAAAASRRIEQDFVPVVSKGPHFHAYYVLDPGDGTLVTISLFAERAGAEEANRLAADWAVGHLGALVSLEEAIIGAVTVHVGM